MTHPISFPMSVSNDLQMPPQESATLADEAQLLDLVRSGDARASESLVSQYAGTMLIVARRFVGPNEAEDVVQESFLSAFRSLNSFRGRARIATWLHRIVVNHCLMRLRRRRRKPEVCIDDLLPSFDETGHHARPVTPWSTRPEDQLNREETRAQVRTRIEQLPDAYRAVILLRDIEEFSTDEAAVMLGISRAAVKIRLHRARQALRALLEPVMSASSYE
jgi:RNA polymerase sigma-70 factor (ECF subfamily)